MAKNRLKKQTFSSNHYRFYHGFLAKIVKNDDFLTHFSDPFGAQKGCQFSVQPKTVHIQGCPEKRTPDPGIRGPEMGLKMV